VRAHEYEACRSALDELIQGGRRRIAFVGHPHDAGPGSISPRYRAYRDAVASSGVELGDGLVVTGAENRVAAYRSAEWLLARSPDAIFSASDRGAISVLIALSHAGVRVPDEVAVLGFGNVPEGEITRPPLTTIGRGREGMEDVARQLFRRLRSADVASREIDLPVRVIWRQST
jgi:DNA-binding LacI/PurR family transcriptional regulator